MSAPGDTDASAVDAAVLAPDSVALVGASDNPEKTSSRPLRFLRRSGWEGRIYPVNPSRPTILGERAWPSIDALPEVPDHAFVLTGADAAVAAVRACAERGVRVATIMADGFVDSDDGGALRRDALRRIVRDTGIRVVGPSSLGVVNVHQKFTLTANAAFAEPDLPAGSVFVASHSGSVIGALVSRGKAMGVGFAGLVSTGGEVDLSLGELCLSTVDDPEVASYALFLESLSGASHLREFARAAADRGKPVLAYKLGRSDAGAELSVSHTGALAGDDVVASALLADLGIGRVDTFDALLEGQQFAGSVPLGARPDRAPRIGVVTTTGGGGAMVVDRLAVLGARVVGPSGATRSRLAELGVRAEHGRLVDLTLAGTRYEVMKSALEVLLSAPEFDAIVAVPGSSARFHPDLAVRPIADSVRSGKPLAAFVVPEAPDALRLLRTAGVSAFRTPEACADAVLAAFARRRPSAPTAGPAPFVDGSHALDEAGSYGVLARLGVPHAPYAVLSTPDSQPVDAQPVDALPVEAPAVVKALSAKLPHKSDVGALVFDVSDVPQLRTSISDVCTAVRRHAPEVELTSVLVQPMVRGLGEVLVGYRYDPAAGPIVLLAAGGVLAEIRPDRSVRTAPVDLPTARDMIAEVVSLRALAGHRGGARGDLDALARAIVAMSRAVLLDAPRVIEAEANPVLVLPEGQGVVAVDALVRVASA